MKYNVFFLLIIGVLNASAQNVSASLEKAVAALQKDPQFAHSVLSMCVTETSSGKVIFEKNAQTGMAPASVQKVITSVTAFEFMGKDFRYKTYIGFDKKDENGKPAGNLVISGTGDPTLGSWRWKQTSQDSIKNKIYRALKNKQVTRIDGSVVIDDLLFGYNPVPDGWIWQDIGNYYGAGARGFNWNENQFEIVLSSPAGLAQKTKMVSSSPNGILPKIANFVTTDIKESGDNAYIYSTPYNPEIFVTGTIPVGQKAFSISGSLPDPALTFGKDLIPFLLSKDIACQALPPITYSGALREGKTMAAPQIWLDSIYSPTFDSMNYWFLKKSVNLYGEAFLKTIAVQFHTEANYKNALEIVGQFWAGLGIDRGSLKMQDGSGLSPANRITTEALTKVLNTAKKQKWFPSFYNALPEMNGIKMKDGYISGVRSYAGYVTSRTGTEYTFALIVNNFDGSPATVREKMWRVLDLLK